MTIQEKIDRKVTLIEGRLDIYLQKENFVGNTLAEAMRYSVFAGGKRLRPVLLLATHELLDGDCEEALALACAIEMIHTYSLIHDDLPAMDNDDIRRGKPTNHKVFGDGFALLAGDGLLNYAFEIMLNNSLHYQHHIVNHIKAIFEIAKGAGVHGMIAGQCLDLSNEGKDIDLSTLSMIHERKTSALILSALMAGLILNNPTQQESEAVCLFGSHVGLSFQIIDDILDIIGDVKKTGKEIGRDVLKDKATFPKFYGLEKSKKIVNSLIDEAVDSLTVFGQKADFLKEYAIYLGKRDY